MQRLCWWLCCVARRAEQRDEAVAKATARWANVQKFKYEFAKASAERAMEQELKTPTPRATIFAPFKVEPKPFGVSLQQLRQLTDQQDHTRIALKGGSKTKKSLVPAATAVQNTGGKSKTKEDQHADDEASSDIEEAEPSEVATELTPEPVAQMAVESSSSSGDTNAAGDSAERRQRLQRLVGNVPLLQQLSEWQIELLSKELTRQQFAAGEAIVTQGEEGNEMYFLETGDAVAEVDGKVRIPQH